MVTYVGKNVSLQRLEVAGRTVGRSAVRPITAVEVSTVTVASVAVRALAIFARMAKTEGRFNFRANETAVQLNPWAVNIFQLLFGISLAKPWFCPGLRGPSNSLEDFLTPDGLMRTLTWNDRLYKKSEENSSNFGERFSRLFRKTRSCG